jgi:hypothetical protein
MKKVTIDNIKIPLFDGNVGMLLSGGAVNGYGDLVGLYE